MVAALYFIEGIIFIFPGKRSNPSGVEKSNCISLPILQCTSFLKNWLRIWKPFGLLFDVSSLLPPGNWMGSCSSSEELLRDMQVLDYFIEQPSPEAIKSIHPMMTNAICLHWEIQEGSDPSPEGLNFHLPRD